jgi:hypothetical protein
MKRRMRARIMRRIPAPGIKRRMRARIMRRMRAPGIIGRMPGPRIMRRNPN